MKTLLSLFTHRIISSRNFSLFHYSGAFKTGITYDPFALLLTLEHNLFQEFRYWGTVGQMELFLPLSLISERLGQAGSLTQHFALIEKLVLTLG